MRLPWDRKDIVKIAYPDNSSYVKVDSFPPDITYRINSYEDLWSLTQIKDVYDHNDKPLSVTIPCLIDAQADRRFEYNQPHSLRLVVEHLKRLNFEKIKIFHPHNQEVVEAMLPNSMFLDNSEFIKNVLLGLYNQDNIGFITMTGFNPNYLQDNLILMSTDAGGFKPLMKLADKIYWKGETFSASKSRKYVDNKSTLVQQVDREDFDGKDILIIDDICVKGGTFVGLAKMLREKNVGKLHLAVSHLTVEDPNRELYDLFDTVFTTDSKGLNYYKEGLAQRKLKIINLF